MWKLLGSAESEDGILSLINEYYFSDKCRLEELEQNTYSIFNGDSLLHKVQVRRKGKRFRFEELK